MSNDSRQIEIDLEPPEARRRPSLSFWDAMTGELDKKYLRVSSVYRLLKRKKIGRARAMELLAQRHSPSEMKILRATVEIWAAGPIRDMAA